MGCDCGGQDGGGKWLWSLSRRERLCQDKMIAMYKKAQWTACHWPPHLITLNDFGAPIRQCLGKVVTCKAAANGRDVLCRWLAHSPLIGRHIWLHLPNVSPFIMSLSLQMQTFFSTWLELFSLFPSSVGFQSLWHL